MTDQIERRVQLSAPLTRVWEALTDAQQFSEWFRIKMLGPFVAGQSVIGQLIAPGYEHITVEFVVQAIEPPHYFSYNWHPYAIDPKVDYSAETPTLVEFRLEEKASGTLLIVTESGFDKLPPERYADAFRVNGRGWEQQLERIRAYVDKTS